MTDKHETLRDALADSPTEGPWAFTHQGVIETNETVIAYVPAWSATAGKPNGEFVAAANPAAIRALLAERDALAAENAALRAELEAVGAGGVSTLCSPAPVQVPLFSLVASRKLAELQANGYEVCGYAVERAEDGPQGGEFGFVTSGGFVGWWRQKR